MPQYYYALLSLVYMMCFVAMFDRSHSRKRIRRFLSSNLLSREELNRLQAIWSACEES